MFLHGFLIAFSDSILWYHYVLFSIVEYLSHFKYFVVIKVPQYMYLCTWFSLSLFLNFL